ncbi:MAG: phosphatase PAP2 family protein [Ferruginibacter sp.]|nr:phosphatase PAP2 family protein [Ferruginibacter sp.]
MKPIISTFKNNRFYFLSLFFFLVTALCVVAIYGGEAVFIDSHEPHPVWLNIFFINYTFMGDGFFALVLAAFYFFYLDKKKTGALLFSSFFLAELIVQLVKNSFNISTFQLFIEQGQYLFLNEKMAVIHEQTFPSGHTAIAFALTMVFIIKSPKRQLQIPAFLAALLLGFSRIYLARDSLLNIAAGAFIGSSCSLFVYVVIKYAGTRSIAPAIKSFFSIHTSAPNRINTSSHH